MSPIRLAVVSKPPRPESRAVLLRLVAAARSGGSLPPARRIAPWAWLAAILAASAGWQQPLPERSARHLPRATAQPVAFEGRTHGRLQSAARGWFRLSARIHRKSGRLAESATRMHDKWSCDDFQSGSITDLQERCLSRRPTRQFQRHNKRHHDDHLHDNQCSEWDHNLVMIPDHLNDGYECNTHII